MAELLCMAPTQQMKEIYCKQHTNGNENIGELSAKL